MSVIQSVCDHFNYLIYKLADPRTQDWWGVSNPLTIISILASYLYFCKSLGPRLMRNRQPFQLKEVLIVYNSFQVLLNLFLVYLATVALIDKEIRLSCIPIDRSNNPRGLLLANATWWYYFAKITELLDTVFFVLRKKYNQVSFLHVYHHTFMASMVWIGLKYIPGGHPVVFGYLNSIVHVIMYTYYLISGLGPQYQKYVWWKKHVTVIQLIQFCLVFAHNFSVLFYQCDYPKLVNVLCCFNAIHFMYMFGKFYVQSYNKTSVTKPKLQTKDFNGMSNKICNSVMDSKEKMR